MREIKFRAWDKVDHQWYKDNPKLSRMTYFANPVVFDDGYLQFESVGQDPIGDHGEDRFELMQFTGLKDKNGKEIYEGDLIRWNSDEDVDYEVFYHDDECRFKCSRTHYHGARCGGYIPEFQLGKDFEIIGNIYENPELLSTKSIKQNK